jgi:hypothetical protein
MPGIRYAWLRPSDGTRDSVSDMYEAQPAPFLSGPAEQPLVGGFVNDVVLAGGTVRKSPPRDPVFVRRLLRHFEHHHWTGAPRFLGTDNRGREMLTFIDGEVPWRQNDEPPSIRSEQSLAAVARHVRHFHDLTAGTDLADGHEVVCHNDLSPKNTVYRDTSGQMLPVAFIDWDIAGPVRQTSALPRRLSGKTPAGLPAGLVTHSPLHR